MFEDPMKQCLKSKCFAYCEVPLKGRHYLVSLLSISFFTQWTKCLPLGIVVNIC
jgi:hypothetical protein